MTNAIRLARPQVPGDVDWGASSAYATPRGEASLLDGERVELVRGSFPGPIVGGVTLGLETPFGEATVRANGTFSRIRLAKVVARARVDARTWDGVVGEDVGLSELFDRHGRLTWHCLLGALEAAAVEGAALGAAAAVSAASDVAGVAEVVEDAVDAMVSLARTHVDGENARREALWLANDAADRFLSKTKDACLRLRPSAAVADRFDARGPRPTAASSNDPKGVHGAAAVGLELASILGLVSAMVLGFGAARRAAKDASSSEEDPYGSHRETRRARPLIVDARLHIGLKALLLAVLVGTIGGLAFSTVALAAEVRLRLEGGLLDGSATVWSDTGARFSLVESVRKLWRSGSRALVAGQRKGAERSHTFERLSVSLEALSCPYSRFHESSTSWDPFGDHLSSRSRAVNAFSDRLAVLIAALSIAGPYAEVSVLLWGYLAPDVRPDTRDVAYKTVAMLSKWSFIDVFVVLVLVVAFHVRFPRATTSTASVAGDIFLELRYAFYAFGVATLTLMLCGQVLLAVHRRTVERADLQRAAASPRARGDSSPARRFERLRFDTPRTCALASHPLRGRAPRRWQRLVAPAACGVGVLLALGLASPAIAIDVGGAAGFALDWLEDGADVRSYSAPELATALRSSAPDDAWRPCVVAAAALTVMFAFAMPYLNLVCLGVLWAVPLRPSTQARLLALTRVTYGWASLDVFLVALVVTGAQLPAIARALAEDNCERVDGALSAFFDAALQGDATCLRLAVHFRPGCVLLAAAAVGHGLLGYAAARAATTAIRERLQGRGDDATGLELEPVHSKLHPGASREVPEDLSTSTDIELVQLQPGRGPKARSCRDAPAYAPAAPGSPTRMCVE